MTKPVILYVEDDSTSRDVMELMVTMALGYPDLVMFEDSHDFMARLEALDPQPDVIFLDIHVGPHDGFAMLKMLRQHPDYARRTVIAVTASVMNEEVQRLMEAGFDGGIAKPLNPRNFPQVMQQVLEGEQVWQII